MEESSIEIYRNTSLEQIKSPVEATQEAHRGQILLECLKRSNADLETINEVAEQRLRIIRRGGQLLAQVPRETKNRYSSSSRDVTSYQQQLEQAGLNRMTAHRWQVVGSLADQTFESFLAKRRELGEEITLAAACRSIAHVSKNAGEDEWYTPQSYIERAVLVMGGIDLDPASSQEANHVVGAEVFFSPEDGALMKSWFGRVWMNPPYTSELIGKFISKLSDHIKNGDVSEAIILINNATETIWFFTIISVASAVVFPIGRVKFWNPDGRVAAPLQGQAVIYAGHQPNRFLEHFRDLGWGAEL